MKLLAIDTSESIARWVGVTESGLLDPVELEAGRKHDTLLGPGIREWLTRQGWSRPDAVAVVVGPGGFTGLRVGVAFATGLAAAWGVEMVPVTLYERLAAMVEQGLVWAIAWGGRDDVRACLMEGGDNPKPLGDVISCHVDQLALPDGGETLLPLGEGYERNRAKLDSLLGGRLRGKTTLRGGAEALAHAARFAWSEGRRVSATEVDVDYGADFVPTPKKNG